MVGQALDIHARKGKLRGGQAEAVVEVVDLLVDPFADSPRSPAGMDDLLSGDWSVRGVMTSVVTDQSGILLAAGLDNRAHPGCESGVGMFEGMETMGVPAADDDAWMDECLAEIPTPVSQKKKKAAAAAPQTRERSSTEELFQELDL